MNKVLICLSLSVALLFCSGCTNIMEQIRRDKELMATPYYDGGYDVTPVERASFYYSNYPNCTDEEKIEMLIRDLVIDKADFSVITKTYKVKRSYIVWNGKEIFPCKSMDGIVVKRETLIYREGLIEKGNVRERADAWRTLERNN